MSRFIDVERWDAPDSEYFSAVGSSSIRRALGHDGPSKAVGNEGNATHIAVLQPSIFHDRVACPPPECRRGSGKGQEARLKTWSAEHNDKIVLTPTEFERVSGMRAALEGRKVLCWLRKNGVLFEQSFRCRDTVTDLVVRLRPDALLGQVCQDLKTSENPSFGAFSKAIDRYAYHVQAALYTDILGLTDWYWLVVGKKLPHRTALYRCPESRLDIGRRLYSAGLAILANTEPDQRPLAWWEDRPLELEEPPRWAEDEAVMHEQYAEQLLERSLA